MATATDSNLNGWKNLLAMSTKASTDDKLNDVYKKLEEDVNAVEQLSMKAENMQFLELAMREAVGVQPDGGPCLFSRFFQLGETEPNVLVNSPEKVAAAKELADQLDDYLLLGNFAEQFKQADGMKALRNLTLSPNEEISLLYLRLIPSLAENRPEFQRVVVESELFTAYLELLDRCRDDVKREKKDKKAQKMSEEKPKETFVPKLAPVLLQAVISAVSSCVRGFEPGWVKFFESKGVNKLVRIAGQSEDTKTAARAAHLLWAINFNFSGEPQKKKTAATKASKPDTEVEEFIDENDLYKQYLDGKHKQQQQEAKKKAAPAAAPATRKVDITQAQARLHRLRSQIVTVYASLDQRIARMEEEKMDEDGEETADAQAFAFLKDTYQQIQQLLLSVDKEDISVDAKSELSTYVKTKNRALRLRDYKAKLPTDVVAKHLGVAQWYTKDEMIAIKKKEAADAEKLSKTMQAILKEEGVAKERMEEEHQKQEILKEQKKREAEKVAAAPKPDAPKQQNAPKPSRKSMGKGGNKKK